METSEINFKEIDLIALLHFVGTTTMSRQENLTNTSSSSDQRMTSRLLNYIPKLIDGPTVAPTYICRTLDTRRTMSKKVLHPRHKIK